MANSDFVHLHLHTLYSLLDSSIRHDPLFQKTQKFGMSAVAMTDHGNLFGAIDFYSKAKNYGIKPIIGCEVYIAPEGRLDKSDKYGLRDASHHLILLAKNDTGYKNLLTLTTSGFLEGFYYKPRIDKEILSQHSEGLIALSSCNRGEIAHNIYKENLPRAKKMAAQYEEIMGKGNFYLEIQNHLEDWEQKIIKETISLGNDLSIPVVATNNCHYLEKSDSRAHEILLCLQTGKTISDKFRLKYENQEYYVKSPQEMAELFKDVPEALKNTLRIAEECNIEFDFTQTNLPEYPVPSGMTLESYLKKLAVEGLEKRLENVSSQKHPAYKERLEEELGIINRMGYPGYFLIVWDFLHYARNNEVPVGPGRGSAAGSLVAYSLNITDIDPLQYDLLFERFLNPERVSLPDIDIDLCMDRRAEVIQYVTEKYGGNRNVAQIITFGSMNAKGVIRDVGRVLDMPYGEVDKIAKLIPNKLGINLKTAFEEVKDFEKLKKENDTVKELLDIAVALEGLPRHCSTHAAGVVISSKQLTEFLPLYKGSADEVVTQFPMNTVEKLGLLKMDFLGLKTLTVIDNAVKKIKETRKLDLNIGEIPLDDEKTYQLLSDARSIGIFQLESSGMRDLLKKMKPDRFEDIVALLALYRPGPLESGMVDDYVKCKHGTQKVKYELPQLQEILSETHGVILYQEQVMKIASMLAKFTLGDADLLRRAMGKKKPEEMAKQREKFNKGCKENNIPEKKAQIIFDLMEKFAGYGFNKSHSAAYAMVSFQTAYLKAHYPLEFFGALITADMDNTDKVTRYINDCREMEISILPPDVNKSYWDFTVTDGKLLFGLGAIKNVGSAAIDSIIETREKTGTFKNFAKFCEETDLRVANRRVMESLIKSGALDSLESTRAHMFDNLQTTMELAQANQKDRALGQSSMFDMLETNEDSTPDFGSSSDKTSDWDDHQRLKFEKETLGFFITGHPLTKYKRELSWFTDVGSANLSECQSGQTISIGGIPSKIVPKVTKKGEKMAFVTLEDLEGTSEITLWPETFAAAENLLASEEPVLVTGKLEGDERFTKIIASAIYPLAEAKNYWRGKLRISLRAAGLEKQTLLEIKKILLEHPGKSDVQLHFTFPNNSTKLLSAGSELTVTPSEEMVNEIEKILGEHSVRFE